MCTFTIYNWNGDPVDNVENFYVVCFCCFFVFHFSNLSSMHYIYLQTINWMLQQLYTLLIMLCMSVRIWGSAVGSKAQWVEKMELNLPSHSFDKWNWVKLKAFSLTILAFLCIMIHTFLFQLTRNGAYALQFTIREKIEEYLLLHVQWNIASGNLLRAF